MKYEFTGERKKHRGTTVYRIRRLRDGLIGGWIEKEENLSNDGNCFVYDDAAVCDKAEVEGHAHVSGTRMLAATRG